MRRLVTLVSVLVFVDTMLFAALTPLLGRFAHEFHLSSGGAGVLVAAYAAGALLGGIPGGAAAAMMGPRRAVLTGLAIMGVASLGFAFADSFAALAFTRLAQGIGSGFTWAGSFSWLMAGTPRERRGTVIGTALGAAVVGALFGPVIGAVADLLGRREVFATITLLAVGLAAITLTIPGRAPERPSAAAMRRALRNRHFLGGLLVLALASLLSGVLTVLAPLHLAGAGWTPAGIGAVWLVAAAIEAVEAPLVGRASDRRGPLTPVRLALAAGAAVSAALVIALGPAAYAALVIAASAVYGILYTPAFALIAEGAELTGLAQGMAFGLMNAAWAIGAIAGPAGAGALAGATGARLPFLVAALTCLAALGAIVRHERASFVRVAPVRRPSA
jgi:MFS family permease